MPLPYQGNPGVFNYNGNPTLIPNFYRTGVGPTGFMDTQSPAQFVAKNPRSAATVTATIGSSITAGDTVELALTHGQLPSGAISYTHTVVTSETVQTVADALASGLNAALESAGIDNIWATSGTTTLASEAVVTVHWAGPLGNFATLSATLSGGASETVTLSPVSGVLAGGAGPVFPANNFSFSYNGVTMAFVYGKQEQMDANLLAALVAQDMPVV